MESMDIVIQITQRADRSTTQSQKTTFKLMPFSGWWGSCPIFSSYILAYTIGMIWFDTDKALNSIRLNYPARMTCVCRSPWRQYDVDMTWSRFWPSESWRHADGRDVITGNDVVVQSRRLGLDVAETSWQRRWQNGNRFDFSNGTRWRRMQVSM